MGNQLVDLCWFDSSWTETPWPEEVAILSITRTFAVIGRQFGKVASAISPVVRQLAKHQEEQEKKLHRTMIIHTTATPIFDETTVMRFTVPPPVSPNCGPRRGPAYDHRGRRRW